MTAWSQSLLIFGLGIVVVFFVLAAQYERGGIRSSSCWRCRWRSWAR